MTDFAGIDVGGRRKGFHVAVVSDRRTLLELTRCATVADAVAVAVRNGARRVGVDSPKTTAPRGATLRECERALAREVCGIRWTPERAKLLGNPYYEWIVHGLELYAALAAAGRDTVEVFPTASWTVWAGPRARRPRAAWSTEGLDGLGLHGLPTRRLSQDDRDAIAAACTVGGPTRMFGAIAVPAPQR